VEASASHLNGLLEQKRQRRLLALDGGGIRGLVTIEILAAVEAELQRALEQPKLVLADWFDYVAGTSTGAIIACCISLGMSIDDIRSFYENQGALMFDRAKLLERYWYKYRSDQLAAMLQQVIGKDETLGSGKLRTLLLLVMRNATTDSHWPLSNNPVAKYNTLPHANLLLPLWQLVRASTAAPVFFPPEEIYIDEIQDTFLFVDGGVTAFNNPAFLLFAMATLEPYRLHWPTGKDKMFLMSVGTGASADANRFLAPTDMNLVYNATKIPAALMYAALVQQDTLCRMYGDCRVGAALDREIHDLCGVDAPGGIPKAFSYCRYEPDLSAEGLADLGMNDVPIQNVQQMDSVAHMADLTRLGRAYAQKYFEPSHLAGFVDTL
jgi:hypothetical protein